MNGQWIEVGVLQLREGDRMLVAGTHLRVHRITSTESVVLLDASGHMRTLSAGQMRLRVFRPDPTKEDVLARELYTFRHGGGGWDWADSMTKRDECRAFARQLLAGEPA